jgi:glycosyltransferase involved in cell wall biosynthesis
MADSATRVTMLLRNPFTHDSRVEKEARSLARAGYRVTVVAEGRQDLPERELRDDVSIMRVPRGAARLPGLRMREYRTRLVEALADSEPDVLHAHDSDALGAVADVAGERRIPFVYDAHELWLGQENRGRSALYHALFKAYYWWLQRRLVPRAAAVLTVSEPIRDRLASTYRVPVSLVPNYPELEDTPPAPRSLRTLLADPIPSNAPIVLYLGGVQPGRGLEELVSALPEVPDAVLVCLGVTDRPRSLVALAEERGVAGRLRPVPPVPSEEVIGWAASATVGVALATPISENNRFSLPNKLFQCMAAGIPVLANDFPHVRAIVEDAGAGLCVDPTDSSAIAAALRRLLADPAAAAEMGRRGAAAVRDRYHWGVSERALLEVYARIAGRP